MIKFNQLARVFKNMSRVRHYLPFTAILIGEVGQGSIVDEALAWAGYSKTKVAIGTHHESKITSQRSANHDASGIGI